MDESRLDSERIDDHQEFLKKQESLQDEPHIQQPQIIKVHNHTSPPKNIQSQKESLKEQIQDVNEQKNQQLSQQSQVSLKDQIFNELGLQRKKDGFAQLRIQEENMNKAAATHLRVCDAIYAQINKRSLISEQSMTVILGFFKERYLQEQQNLNVLQVKSPAFLGIFKDPDSQNQNKSYYPQLTSVLETFNGLTQKQAQSLKILISNIDKLIKNKIEDNITQYSKCVKEYRTNQVTMKKNVSDNILKTQKQSQKYCRVFNEMESNGGNHKKRTKDLFYLETKLKKCTQEQLQSQEQYGEMIFNFWNQVLKLEALRLEIIQNGLQTFIENQQEAYNGSKGGAQIQLVIKTIQELQPVKQCEQTFTTSEILLPSQFLEISGALSMPPGQQPQVQEVKKFLIAYPSSILKQISNQNHPLVLKLFNKISRDNGTIMSSWKKIVIIVSLDKNVLIYDSEDGTVPYAKAQYKFVIENCELVQTKKFPLTAELKQTIPGIVFDSHQTVIIRFDSQDEFEELQFYIGSHRVEFLKKQNK